VTSNVLVILSRRLKLKGGEWNEPCAVIANRPSVVALRTDQIGSEDTKLIIMDEEYKVKLNREFLSCARIQSSDPEPLRLFRFDLEGESKRRPKSSDYASLTGTRHHFSTFKRVF